MTHVHSCLEMPGDGIRIEVGIDGKFRILKAGVELLAFDLNGPNSFNQLAAAEDMAKEVISGRRQHYLRSVMRSLAHDYREAQCSKK